jgi:TetR/AcrR family transcriptional regulator, copper-responsive repressor
MNRGRPREFDEKEALHKAMMVFWRNGYRGTSLDDLTQALEINRPSLYAAFKDKETLFLRVVDHYVEQTIGPAMIALAGSGNLRSGLTQFFQSYADIVAGEDTPPGCFVACLLSEECCESPIIKEKLATLLEAADRICTKAFERKKAELNPMLSPEAAGSLLNSTIDGFALRARAGASRQTILKLGDSFIELVVAT